ncbi:MAG TPA: ribosome small subunit-dependent GTPase A [Chlamydiales bacterium]|nr:ribosome small subunit-dependent GTPase A [Chlamydiales bacterium]
MSESSFLEGMGYDDFFESYRLKYFPDSIVARVIAEYKGLYKVKNKKGEYLAKITGKQIFQSEKREDYPAVGDWVVITLLDEENALIQKILPRKTIVKRKYSGRNENQIIATNIDTALIVESLGRDYSLNRFERYFALALDSGIRPVIVLNKIDLISEIDLEEKLLELKERFQGVEIYPVSALSGIGLNDLKSSLEIGRTYCFLGSSGVGKSSLINQLIGQDRIKTGNISFYSDRGKHVTTSREMYFLENGAVVIDNPGMREVGMTDTEVGVDSLFDEIKALSKQCKFFDCTHKHEPGCAVKKALEKGELDQRKYDNYMRMDKEVEYYEQTEMERKEKSKKFGKFLKNAKKDFKKYKHKDY